MATVYLAHDPRFGRDVALKAVAVGYKEDPTFRKRFEREARTIATLEHPAIVPVYDFGEDNDQLYLVMRYMPNGSLSDRIVMGRQTPEQAIPVIRRIADALDHAHQSGVVHRDLKPGNILFDEYERAYLSDFGIVKLAAEGTAADLTGSGVIGTPAYMSPEQIHGDQVIDGRSDIYTLGVILFEMLTGRKPYRADTPVKQMMAHVMDPVPDIAALLPNFPPESVPILQKALAKEPDARYQKAQALTADLTSTLTGHQYKPIQRTAPPEPADHDADTISQELPTVTNMIETPELDDPITIAKESKPDPPTIVAPKKEAPLATSDVQKRPTGWLYALGGILAIAVVAFLIFQNRDQTPSDTATNAPVEVVVEDVTSTLTQEPNAIETPVAEEVETAVSDPDPTTSTMTPTTFGDNIGTSIQGSEIVLKQLGDGQHVIILVGGIHAGRAPATVDIVEQLFAQFEADPALIPTDVTLLFLPNVNPDSVSSSSRFNANDVDINMNWGCNWAQNSSSQDIVLSNVGGERPFSEPETAQLKAFIEAQAERAVGSLQLIIWDAPIGTGWVSAGSCEGTIPTASSYERLFGGAAGYLFGDVSVVQDQPSTGGMADWLVSQNIPAITVWLPDADTAVITPNLDGLLAIINRVSNE